MMLSKRFEYDLKPGKDNVQWHNSIFPILLTCNDKSDPSTTGMTPAEATKEDKQVDATLILDLNAQRTRKYPDLVVGDLVKIMLNIINFTRNLIPCSQV